MTIHSGKASQLATEHRNNMQGSELNTPSATSKSGWTVCAQTELRKKQNISCLDHISN